jgi:aconitate hydratase 2/2-methylisocitrate dehydratase
MGDNARVYLGSTELAAVAALYGRLPTPDEYFSIFAKKIQPYQREIYRYLQFDQMQDIGLEYA